METKIKKRIEWVDIAKGIGILCVLFGHIEATSPSIVNGGSSIQSYLVNSFHMPLFFFLSGFCFSDKAIGFLSFAWKKFKSLIIPLVTFSVIWIVYDSATDLLRGAFSAGG